MQLRNFLFIVVLAFLASCSPYDKVLKSKDYALKLEKANEYYAQGKWYRAGELYQQIIPVYKATKEYEDIFFKYCYTLFNAKDYLTASYQFKNFVEFFPNSAKADECMYMHGVSLYKDSNRSSLDPTSTIKAREVLVNYVNTHPGSPLHEDAMRYISECTEKLETKSYNAANLYYHMEQYKAAAIAFQQLTEQFVESKKTDYYMFMKFKSSYLYATQSVTKKQEERYGNSITYFKEFKNFYPQSTYIKEAEKIVAIAEKNLNQLKNEHK